MPRPAKVTDDRLVDEAIAIIARDGLGELTVEVVLDDELGDAVARAHRERPARVEREEPAAERREEERRGLAADAGDGQQDAGDGRATAPWCFAIQSGSATGWAATDWVEDLMIRRAGRDAYQQWVAGDLEFASEPVAAAFNEFQQMVLAVGRLAGGPEVAISSPVRAVFDGLLDPEHWSFVREARRAIERVAPLLDNLLELARDGEALPSARKPLRLHDVIELAVRTARPLLRDRGISVECELAAQPDDVVERIEAHVPRRELAAQVLEIEVVLQRGLEVVRRE